MKQFKIFIDFSKEEQYLKEMAKKGKIFKKSSIFGCYHFVNSVGQDLKYRVDYRTFIKNKDFESYKAMFEDFGWDHIAGSKYSGRQYFLPKDKNSNGEIFSNKESAALRYKKLFEMCVMSMLIAFINFSAALSSYEYKLSNITFQTPGLWERSGSDLIKGILFEFPFLALRVVPTIFLVGMGLFYGALANKVKKLYKEKTL